MTNGATQKTRRTGRRKWCGGPVLLLAGPFLMGLAGVSVSAHAQAERCVRVLGYEWSGEKQSMDPADMQSGDDAYHIFPTYNRLVDVDDNFQPVPELAERWEASADGRTWTFHLRHGVKFHSGKPFTAADAAYTFKRILDPKLGSGGASTLSFLTADGIKAVSDDTLTFTTDKPVSELPVLIANKYTNIVSDGAKHEDLRLHGDGTGPFMQQQFQPNGPVRILKANPNYWGGKPKADCIRVTVAQEPVTAVAALKSGDVDLVLNVDPSVIGALKDDPSVSLLQTAASNSMTVSMFVDTKPFDEPKVRQAMKLAIDRQALVDTVLLGYGEVGADNPVPLSSPASFTTNAPKFDPAQAKKLLAEAGHADGLSITLDTAEGVPGMTRMAEAVATMLKQAGFDVRVNVNPADSYWDSVWLKRPLATSAWSMRPPGEALAYPYRISSTVNETHWKRPEYDALLDRANTTVDAAARMKLYQQAGQMLAEQGGVIIPMFIHQVVALRKGCTGYTPRVQNFNLKFNAIACE